MALNPKPPLHWTLLLEGLRKRWVEEKKVRGRRPSGTLYEGMARHGNNLLLASLETVANNGGYSVREGSFSITKA
jgi:hypothetical protein